MRPVFGEYHSIKCYINGFCSFQTIIPKLLRNNKKLRVVIITLENSYEGNLGIEEFCNNHQIGLKIVIPGIGLQTIVRTDLDAGYPMLVKKGAH